MKIEVINLGGVCFSYDRDKVYRYPWCMVGV